MKKLLVALALAGPLPAQQWQHLPNGGLAYRTDYTSSGYWQCNNWFLSKGACQVNGSSVTLTNGGSTLTLNYQGYSSQVLASIHGQKIPVGQITKTTTGTPWIFPLTGSPNAPYLSFAIGVTTPTGIGGWEGGYLLRGQRLNTFARISSSTLRILPPPAPATYGGLYLYHWQQSELLTDPEPTEITAMATINPEPEVLLLLASGLVFLGLALWRRLS